MAYNEALAARIRARLSQVSGLTEKKMFGGVGFLVNGNMACGVNGEDMIVRVGPEKYIQALAQPDTGVFDMTGKPMTGWIKVKPDGIQDEHQLADWVQQGLDYAFSLPPK
jgi:TfoX/Sxy family transcriptional regulator of competence genes